MRREGEPVGGAGGSDWLSVAGAGGVAGGDGLDVGLFGDGGVEKVTGYRFQV